MSLQAIRQQFPMLHRKFNRKPLVFLDGPAGTQVPTSVIEAVSHYYRNSNANVHGAFVTSRETDAVMDSVREKVSAFLGAAGPQCISLGQNMTTLNFSLSHAIGKVLQIGDEILITQLDHEANRGPWLNLRDRGMVVREVKILADGTLDYDDFKSKINEKTRLVAMGYASNIFGTVNEVVLVRKWTYEVGAWLLIDAVHYAPHLPIDVEDIGCDFLLCSAYKFYGPHVGILYAKEGLLDRLPTDRLRTADQRAPLCIETGTANHAAMAGVAAAIDFIGSMGKGKNIRAKILKGISYIKEQEKRSFSKLYDGLGSFSKVRIYGPSNKIAERAPTLSFTVKGKTAKQVCTALAAENICAWSGHFYALRATEVLALNEKGGVTRMGMAVYTSEEDIHKTLKAMEKIM